MCFFKTKQLLLHDTDTILYIISNKVNYNGIFNKKNNIVSIQFSANHNFKKNVIEPHKMWYH